jgi:hypothetical protein
MVGPVQISPYPKLTSSPYLVHSGHVRCKLTPELSILLLLNFYKRVQCGACNLIEVVPGRMSGKRIGTLDGKKDNKVIRTKLLHVHRCNNTAVKHFSSNLKMEFSNNFFTCNLKTNNGQLLYIATMCSKNLLNYRYII